jgi:hypothetical protein
MLCIQIQRGRIRVRILVQIRVQIRVRILTINVPLFKKLRDIIFFLRDNKVLSHFEGHFEGAKTFLTPQNVP